MVGESSVGSSYGPALLLGSGRGCCGSHSGTVVHVVVGIVLESTEAVDRDVGTGRGGWIIDTVGPGAVVLGGSKVEPGRWKNHVRRCSAVHQAGSHAEAAQVGRFETEFFGSTGKMQFGVFDQQIVVGGVRVVVVVVVTVEGSDRRSSGTSAVQQRRGRGVVVGLGRVQLQR